MEVYVSQLRILELIKTIKKFSNVIGYHQPDLSTTRTVYRSCLKLDSVIGQLKGQLTPHASVSGQNVSYARAVVSYFAELTIVFFFFYKNVEPMSSFFLKLS